MANDSRHTRRELLITTAMIVVIMGVAGSGKTTIGRMLGESLHCPFLDGDALHPAVNIEKMSRGIPLSDSDRAPWLAAIHSHAQEAFNQRQDLVIACSALKLQYREVLSRGLPFCWVYLKGSRELIRSRIEGRQEHFMKVGMLDSQLQILEEPRDALTIEISAPPHEIVDRILASLPITR